MQLQAIFSLDAYWRKILPLGILFFAYAAAAQISLHLQAFHGIIPIIWPPAGIALAALFLWGYELWPAVFLAAFASAYAAGVPIGAALGISASSALGTLGGAYVLREFAELDPFFSRLRDALALIWVGIFVPILTTTFSIAALSLWGVISPADITTAWISWWIGHMLSILVLSPFLIRWLFKPLFTRTRAQALEWVASFGLLLSIDALVFWTPFSQVDGIPLAYFVLVPFIWIALRLGPRAMTLALFLTAFSAVAGSEIGLSGRAVSANTLFLLQIFVGVLSTIFLIFVCIEEERKESAKKLREHLIQLEEAIKRISGEDQAKNEFIAVLAHELRNPLAPIVSSLELLRIQEPQAEARSLIDNMYEHTRTIGRLLDDLLDISRISQKKFKLQKENVDLRPLILRCVHSIEPVMKNRGHAFTVTLPDHPIFIEADPVRLEQIVINLLTNAAKYTEPGGAIELACADSAGELVISVKDTGIGLETHMLERIFEPFTQVERGTRMGGLGLGLSLTKRLVEMHHGSIEVRSAGLGRGSEFTVRLPLPKRSVQLPLPGIARRRERSKPLAATGHSFRILIVDDNEAAAQGLGKLLAYRGHEVELAYDGPAALSAAEAFSPEIVILDLGLPGMDGFEVAKRLREAYGQGLALIALTGYGQEEDRKKTEQAGFNYHLTKPVGIVEVEAALGLMVDNKVLSG